MDEATRTKKLTKFGSEKFVYPPELMRKMRMFFASAINARLPSAMCSTGPDWALATTAGACSYQTVVLPSRAHRCAFEPSLPDL